MQTDRISNVRERRCYVDTYSFTGILCVQDMDRFLQLDDGTICRLTQPYHSNAEKVLSDPANVGKRVVVSGPMWGISALTARIVP